MPQYTYPEDFEGTFWTIIDGDYYVSTYGNDVQGDGSPKNPYLTVGKAFEFAIDGEKVVIGPDEYVEKVSSGAVGPENFGAEPPCRLATTTNINLTAGGVVTVDGVLTNAGDRILVWQQNDPVENGIYIAASGAWERAVNYNSDLNIIRGKLIPILEGNTHANTIFQNATTSSIVVGVTGLTFEKTTGASQEAPAKQTVTHTGTTFSADFAATDYIAITLQANITALTFANLPTRKTVTLEFIQDTAGSRDVLDGLDANVITSDGVLPDFSYDPNSSTIWKIEQLESGRILVYALANIA